MICIDIRKVGQPSTRSNAQSAAKTENCILNGSECKCIFKQQKLFNRSGAFHYERTEDGIFIGGYSPIQCLLMRGHLQGHLLQVNFNTLCYHGKAIANFIQLFSEVDEVDGHAEANRR